jgi:P-type Mg2+ transporter
VPLRLGSSFDAFLHPTQVLVVFAIRTRRRFFQSRPHRFLVAMAFGSLAVASPFCFSQWASGSVSCMPPPMFFAYLVGATAAYLALVEILKGVFCRVPAGRGRRPSPAPASPV